MQINSNDSSNANNDSSNSSNANNDATGTPLKLPHLILVLLLDLVMHTFMERMVSVVAVVVLVIFIYIYIYNQRSFQTFNKEHAMEVQQLIRSLKRRSMLYDTI